MGTGVDLGGRDWGLVGLGTLGDLRDRLGAVMTGKELKAWAAQVPDSAIVICAEKPSYSTHWSQYFQLSFMSELSILSHQESREEEKP